MSEAAVKGLSRVRMPFVVTTMVLLLFAAPKTLALRTPSKFCPRKKGEGCMNECLSDPANQIVTPSADGTSATVELLNCFAEVGSSTKNINVAPDSRKCSWKTKYRNVLGMTP